MRLSLNFALRSTALIVLGLVVACGPEKKGWLKEDPSLPTFRAIFSPAAEEGWLKSNPGHLTFRSVFTPVEIGDSALTSARVSTKSGEILILEPDGEVTPLDLDSPQGSQAYAVSEADLAELSRNLDLNLGGGRGAFSDPDGKTAQEEAIDKFAARTRPALPALPKGIVISPEDFISVRVDVLNSRAGGDLVEVKANLRRDVHPNVAYSYTVCALAGWAEATGTDYGRHIRTLQDKKNEKLLIGAAFVVSEKKPLGLRVMETEETLRECKARGIPVA